MKRTIFTFTALIVAVLCLFQLVKYSYTFGHTSIEVVIASIAMVFFLVGSFLNGKNIQGRPFRNEEINLEKVEKIGLSKREYEVLLEISKGLSNREIGNKMFLSESTIKTHVSNIFVKLDAKRRTQAILKAKELQII